MQRALNARQERFVHEFLIDQNAAAATRRAGYSEKTRGAQAAALMRNPLIRERIELGLADMFAKLDINAFELLREEKRAAFFRPRKLFGADGAPLPLEELDEDLLDALTIHYNLRKNGDYVLQVRQPSRRAALNALERRYLEFLRMQTQTLEENGWDEDGDEDEDAPAPQAEAGPPPAQRVVLDIENFDPYRGLPDGARPGPPQLRRGQPQQDAVRHELAQAVARARSEREAQAAPRRAAAPPAQAAATPPRPANFPRPHGIRRPPRAPAQAPSASPPTASAPLPTTNAHALPGYYPDWLREHAGRLFGGEAGAAPQPEHKRDDAAR